MHVGEVQFHLRSMDKQESETEHVRRSRKFHLYVGMLGSVVETLSASISTAKFTPEDNALYTSRHFMTLRSIVKPLTFER